MFLSADAFLGGLSIGYYSHPTYCSLPFDDERFQEFRVCARQMGDAFDSLCKAILDRGCFSAVGHELTLNFMVFSEKFFTEKDDLHSYAKVVYHFVLFIFIVTDQFRRQWTLSTWNLILPH
jgi:hypothetical protein